MNQLCLACDGSNQCHGSRRRISRAWSQSFLTCSRQHILDESTFMDEPINEYLRLAFLHWWHSLRSSNGDFHEDSFRIYGSIHFNISIWYDSAFVPYILTPIITLLNWGPIYWIYCGWSTRRTIEMDLGTFGGGWIDKAGGKCYQNPRGVSSALVCLWLQ